MDPIKEKRSEGLVDDDQPEETQISPVSLNSLPEELIEMIFSFLNDPKDLLSVSNSSSRFTRILTPKKPVFMFGEVFPLIFADLDQEDILNCRLVCKQWNRSVDSYLQNWPGCRYHEPYPSHSIKMTSTSNQSSLQKAIACNNPPYRPVYQPRLCSKDFFPINFDHPEKVSNFLQETSTHPRNPFILRLISLNAHRMRRGESRAYWRDVTGSLLANFGQEVYHLQIVPTTGRGPDHDIFPYYRRLLRTLRMLPNLKTLELYRHDRYLPPISRQLATRIQGYMDINPLPPLPHLETFTETLIVRLPREPIIIELMKRYSSQLKTIQIGLEIWQEDVLELSNLPQCTSLDICLDDSLKKWKKLCRQLEAPNLGKLSLNVHKTCGISQLLRPLQQRNFQSLVYLQLRFMCKLRRDRRESEADNQFLLENVKTLEVFDNSNVPYDFLLNHLPKLEYMFVCYDPRVYAMKEEICLEDGLFEIRKWMYSRAMYKSNIWMKMEHLKEFILARLGGTGDTECEIESKVIYKRGEYNRLTEAKNLEDPGNENQ